MLTYYFRKKKILKALADLDSPPPITVLTEPVSAMRTLRARLKRMTPGGKKWNIKQDDSKGMIIASCEFSESNPGQVTALSRQIVLTCKIMSTEAEKTEVQLFYSVYSPFNRMACDHVIRTTTEEIKESFSKEN